MDKSLETQALEIFRDRYQDQSGKRFILHLISAFMCSEIKPYSYENTPGKMRTDGGVCCILNIKLTMDDTDHIKTDNTYYGYMSDKSDKLLSAEAYKALRKFVELMAGMKDKDILKISKYLVKEKKPKSKNEAPKEKVFKESRTTYEDIQAII